MPATLAIYRAASDPKSGGVSTAMWLYVHPVTALLAVAALAYAGQLGFRSRQVRRDGRFLLRRHARLTPYVYALVVFSWVLGAVSVRWGRSDLDFADSGHFKVGCYVIAVLSLAMVLSRLIDRVPNGRVIHPLLGALAVLLAAFQVFLGLQIMPK